MMNEKDFLMRRTLREAQAGRLPFIDWIEPGILVPGQDLEVVNPIPFLIGMAVQWDGRRRGIILGTTQDDLRKLMTEAEVLLREEGS
jgi:hypothetical protein